MVERSFAVSQCSHAAAIMNLPASACAVGMSVCLHRLPDLERIDGVAYIVHAHQRRAAADGRERCRQAAGAALLDSAPGERADRRLARQAGDDGVAERDDLGEAPQQLEVMVDRLAET